MYQVYKYVEQMDTILYIVDLAEEGEKMLHTALDLSNALKANLIIWPIAGSQKLQEAQYHYRELIAEVRKLKPTGIRIIPLQQFPTWQTRLPEVLDRHSVKIIVLDAGKNREKMARFILDHSKLPLWISSPHSGMDRCKQMVFASDFRFEHLAILSELMFLARSLDAHIHCIHFKKGEEAWNQKQDRLYEQLYHLDKASPLLSFDIAETQDVKESLIGYQETHPVDILVLGTHDFVEEESSLSRDLLAELQSHVLIYHVNSSSPSGQTIPEVPTQVNYMLI